MKLRTFYALCFLCLSRSFAAEQDPTSNTSESQESENLELYLDEGNPRDKRALGLILSGLAQVFGYDVSPVQVASLPNTELPTVIALSANATQQTVNASTSSATTSPGQRETIRFTGVLNFGNNGSLLNQLQEYEQIFHGTSNVTGPRMNATSPTSTEPPVDIRQPLAPLLVNIPLPVMRQPPLPEIPPQDIKLSYPPLVPIRYAPVRGQQETMKRNNETSVNQTTVSQPIQNGKEVKPSRVPVGFTGEPPWKKEYEERLAELERKQAEHAERLRQQERYRNRVKDDDYNNEDDRWNQGKGDENAKCAQKEKDGYNDSYSSVEDDGSSERYRDQFKRPNESQEDDEIRDYEDRKPLREQEDFPVSDNYTNVQFNEPLPITGDHEQQWPEQLRNSYGELLNSSELDDGFVNFFNHFKDSSLYTLPDSQGSKENLKDEDYSRSKEDGDESGEKRKEDDLPAGNKYEEYSLEDDGDTKRKDNERKIVEDVSDETDKLPNKFFPSVESRYKLDGQKSKEEVNYSSFMPLIVPARYVYAPEEEKEATSRLAMIEKPIKITVTNRDGGKKVQSKESWSTKKENPKPKPTILERQLPKKLHEEEQKDLQLWPPPFDFLLDSTIQTDIVPGKLGRRYVKFPFATRKVESRDERAKDVQKTGRPMTTQSPGQRIRDSSEDIAHERFKEVLKPQIISSRQFAESVNRENRTRSEVAGAKQPRQRVQQSVGIADYWNRYKYTTSDNYLVNNRPNIELVPRTQQQTIGSYSKRFEGLKHSTEKIDPVLESYFTERPSVVNSKMAGVNHEVREFQMMMPDFVPPTIQGTGYFHFPAMNYQLAEKVDNERAIGIIAPRQEAYWHDESFTKFASEPENRGEKVGTGSYLTGTHDVDVIGQKDVELSRSMDYVDYVRML